MFYQKYCKSDLSDSKKPSRENQRQSYLMQVLSHFRRIFNKLHVEAIKIGSLKLLRVQVTHFNKKWKSYPPNMHIMPTLYHRLQNKGLDWIDDIENAETFTADELRQIIMSLISIIIVKDLIKKSKILHKFCKIFMRNRKNSYKKTSEGITIGLILS